MIDWIKKWGVVRVVAPQFGKAHLGFSPQGAMDQSCLKRLKEEFEFDQEESSIWEVPSLSAKLRAQTPSFCLLVGASRPILIKNKKGLVIREQMKNQMFELDTSETLELGYSVEGVYSYLLISTQRLFRNGEVKNPKNFGKPIRVYPGLEVNKQEAEAFCKQSWIVQPNSNRMGIRLEVHSQSPAKTNVKLAAVESHCSNPVWDGVIQWTGSELIVLHRYRATLGGYARVLEVNREDLNRLAQFKAGELVRFKLLELK
jgi:allophanate hydrolase subunit 2